MPGIIHRMMRTRLRNPRHAQAIRQLTRAPKTLTANKHRAHRIVEELPSIHPHTLKLRTQHTRIKTHIMRYKNPAMQQRGELIGDLRKRRRILEILPRQPMMLRRTHPLRPHQRLPLALNLKLRIQQHQPNFDHTIPLGKTTGLHIHYRKTTIVIKARLRHDRFTSHTSFALIIEGKTKKTPSFGEEGVTNELKQAKTRSQGGRH